MRFPVCKTFVLGLSCALIVGCDSSETSPDMMGGSDSCVNISGAVEGSEVALVKPTMEPEACIETQDPMDADKKSCTKKDAPDFGCFGVADPDAGPSTTVTMKGCVAAFGLGGDTHGLTISVFREFLLDGTRVDPGYDLDGMPGAQADNTPAGLIGRTVSVKAMSSECEDEGSFELAGVPTETDLAVRVTHQSLDKDSREFVDTYQFNVRLSNGAVEDEMGNKVTDTSMCDATTCFVTDTVNTITITTFLVIPPTARVSSILGSEDLYDGFGQGHIAGEVQDCTSEDTVANAVVGIDGKAKQRTYFNVGLPPDRDNLADPKAEVTRTMTNADGLFAFLAVDTVDGATSMKISAAMTPSVCGDDGICQCTEDSEPNPQWTAADANEGEVQVLGTRSIYVFPDSITLVSFDKSMYVSR